MTIEELKKITLTPDQEAWLAVYYVENTIRDEKAERTAKERGIEILPIDKYTQL